MTEEKAKKTEAAEAEATGGSSKQIIIVVGLVAVVLGAVFLAGGKDMLTGGSVSTEAALNNVSPASSDASGIQQGDPVVATINETKVMRSEVFGFIAQLPEQTRQTPLEQLFPAALEQVVNNKLLEMKASKANLKNNPQVKQIVDQAREQAIRTVYLQQKIDEKLTDTKLQEAYGQLTKSVEGVRETRASHILVEDEAKAKELITKLDGGADFAELAKEHSTGPTGPNGGDLGYFAQAEMVPEFANSAFEIEVGKHSAAPVKTQFGWHVIKVADRRDRQIPTFEALKPQLKQQMQQQALNELMAEWKEASTIKKFDINGNEIQPIEQN